MQIHAASPFLKSPVTSVRARSFRSSHFTDLTSKIELKSCSARINTFSKRPTYSSAEKSRSQYASPKLSHAHDLMRAATFSWSYANLRQSTGRTRTLPGSVIPYARIPFASSSCPDHIRHEVDWRGTPPVSSITNSIASCGQMNRRRIKDRGWHPSCCMILPVGVNALNSRGCRVACSDRKLSWLKWAVRLRSNGWMLLRPSQLSVCSIGRERIQGLFACDRKHRRRTSVPGFHRHGTAIRVEDP